MKRHLRVRFRWLRRLARQFFVHTVLHVDDPPQRIARGVAVAVFIAFTPTVGFQMVLAVFFAWLLRANKAVCIPIVWISNPATILPILYTCYRIGRKIMGGQAVGAQWWIELAHPPAAWWPRVQFFWERAMEIAAPLWVGCFVVGSIAAYASYYISYYAICGYRMKRWGQLMPPPPKRVKPRKKSRSE